MSKAATEWPICFQAHPFVKCGYGLRGGFITEHDPKKAKTKLVDLGLGNVCGKSGK